MNEWKLLSEGKPKDKQHIVFIFRLHINCGSWDGADNTIKGLFAGMGIKKIEWKEILWRPTNQSDERWIMAERNRQNEILKDAVLTIEYKGEEYKAKAQLV